MNQPASNTSFDLDKIKNQALAVITKPAEFYRSMPKTGGFVEPMIFIAAISLVTAAIQAAFTFTTSFGAALGMLILIPLLAPLFAFIGAAIVFVIWKLMGSRENYETAYRCVAYASAVAPITTLLSFIPYLGTLVSAAWGFYITVISSVEVHQIPRKKAMIVWGILFALFALANLSAERKARQFEQDMREWSEQSGLKEDMTPEEAGEALGKFLRGMEKAAEEQQGQQAQE